MLPRIHLFEWNDRPWLPELLWRSITEYLTAVIERMRPFSPLAPKLADLTARHGARIVADRRLPEPSCIRAIWGCVGNGAIDARAVPARLPGIRTMSDAIHHLQPDDARAVLADARRVRAPIPVADAKKRSLLVIVASIVFIRLLVLGLTPFIRPLSGWRLVFTSLVPVLPLMILWDGVVSCLRTYTPGALLALCTGVDGYTWEAKVLRVRGGAVTYLLGEPTLAGGATDESYSGVGSG